MALLLQEGILFSDSVKDDIAFGRPGASDAEIEAAARAANAHEFIAALPDGFHTPVGERGSKLSAEAALPRRYAHDRQKRDSCAAAPQRDRNAVAARHPRQMCLMSLLDPEFTAPPRCNNLDVSRAAGGRRWIKRKGK